MTPRYAAHHLGLYCLLMSHIKDDRLSGNPGNTTKTKPIYSGCQLLLPLEHIVSPEIYGEMMFVVKATVSTANINSNSHL